MTILLPKRRRKRNFSLVMCLQLSVLSVATSQEQCTTCPLLRAVLEPVIMQNNDARSRITKPTIHVFFKAVQKELLIQKPKPTLAIIRLEL